MTHKNSASKPAYYLVVAGGRDFNDFDYMKREILSLMWHELKDYEVVIISGECPRGADYWAKTAAWALKLRYMGVPADWKEHGKAAGPIRNRYMAEHGSGLLAFWDGESRGTSNMIDEMRAKGKPVRVREY